MTDDRPRLVKCSGCGHEAATSGEEWDAAPHRHLGTIARCPLCGTANVHLRI